jgi:hypothetical protein
MNALEKEKKAVPKMTHPKLMYYLIKEVQKEGIVGEEDSIIVMALKISLRLVKNASATSSNLLVSDDTGGGKDFLTSGVCRTMLRKESTYFHRTAISPKVFNYWQPINLDTEEEVSWNGKILYLEDPESELIKSQAFKVMASGGTAITVVKDQEVFQKQIDGKPVIIITSMKTTIDIEGERRWDCIRLDLSPQLTEKVKERVALKAAGLIEYEPDEGFRSLLQTLLRVEVVVPFAKKLIEGLSDHSNIRTQVLKLIEYTMASAALHQYARKKDKKGRIIAEPMDFEYARLAFIKLRDEEALAVTKKEQELIDYLRNKKTHVKIRDIIDELEGYTKDWIYRHKEDLIERRIISIVMDFDPDSNRDIEHFKYTGESRTKSLIPTAKALFKDDNYVCSGQLYWDINKERKEEGLLPLFHGLIEKD